MDVLLFNANAGRVKLFGITAGQILSKLRDRGIDVTAPQPPTNGAVISSAIESRGRIIVVGGDGTIHKVLQAAEGCRVIKLAIIPAGTANHLATALGIPSDLDAAIDIIAAGHTRCIDLGTINGTVFSQAAGAGFHASAFHLYGEHKEKSLTDAVSAVVTALGSWEPQLMRVVIDGTPYLDELTQITAANTPVYGGVFHIAPQAVLDDGLLDIVILGNLNKLELVEYGLLAMDGAISRLHKTFTTQARRIEITTVGDTEVELHADALPAGHTPAVIEVMPKCLDVVVPMEQD